jgi:hypothetical protein
MLHRRLYSDLGKVRRRLRTQHRPMLNEQGTIVAQRLNYRFQRFDGSQSNRIHQVT